MDVGCVVFWGGVGGMELQAPFLHSMSQGQGKGQPPQPSPPPPPMLKTLCVRFGPIGERPAQSRGLTTLSRWTSMSLPRGADQSPSALLHQHKVLKWLGNVGCNDQ